MIYLYEKIYKHVYIFSKYYSVIILKQNFGRSTVDRIKMVFILTERKIAKRSKRVHS